MNTPTKQGKSKLFLVAGIALLALLFFVFDLDRYLTLESLREHKQAIETYRGQHPFTSIAVYMLIYILTTALSLPGAAVLTLAGGAIFGLLLGTLIVSFASTIGATCAFLVARYLLRDGVQQRFGDRLEPINRGVEREGAFYLFTLRLVPAFPFFVVNLLMALTPMRVSRFFLVSQIGMLPGTVAYVYAGTQLAQIDSLSGILSPGLLAAFVILGVLPLVSKKIVEQIRMRKLLERFPPPKSYDYNMVVIGAGSGGLVASYIAAAMKAKVALIEKHQMGGDCLNTGCVPSKALIRSSTMLSYARRAREYGFKSMQVDFDFSEVMDRVQDVVKKIEPHDSVERYTKLGVECISGEARIKSPFEVAVNGKVLTTRSIVVASGAEPFVPAIPGLEDVEYLTSDTIWGLRELPQKLVIIGGGPIGCELAQSFRRFGAEVTLVEMLPRILPQEDEDVSALMVERFEDEGIRILTDHRAVSVSNQDGTKVLRCSSNGQEIEVAFDHILLALGRRPRVSGFGLEELGVEIAESGVIATDEFMRTNFPNIYVVGDAAGPYQFTHVAAHQAWYASVNALLSPFKSFRTDYRVIPWCTFTDPEVAHVGLNEKTAREKKIPYTVTKYGLDDLDRAIADGEAHGFVKVLTPPGKDRILGATIVGYHAGDLLSEFVFAMKHRLGLNKILGTIHSYPTLAEANKYAAGQWRKAHAPQKVLAYLERFHAWRRRGRGHSGPPTRATPDDSKFEQQIEQV